MVLYGSVAAIMSKFVFVQHDMKEWPIFKLFIPLHYNFKYNLPFYNNNLSFKKYISTTYICPIVSCALRARFFFNIHACAASTLSPPIQNVMLHVNNINQVKSRTCSRSWKMTPRWCWSTPSISRANGTNSSRRIWLLKRRLEPIRYHFCNNGEHEFAYWIVHSTPANSFILIWLCINIHLAIVKLNSSLSVWCCLVYNLNY